MRYIPKILLVSLSLLIAIPVIGCSDGRLRTEPVIGVITLDGEPLADATVRFSPKVEGEGAPGFARTNERGEYRLQTMQGNPNAGTLPGEYAVTIVKYREVPTGRRDVDVFTGETTEEMTTVLLFPRMQVYADIATTPFSATVVKGRNHFDFNLESQ